MPNGSIRQIRRVSSVATTLLALAALFIGTVALAQSGNPANDRLLARSSAEQANLLGYVVGEGCTGRDAFYMGMQKSGRIAACSIRCSDGRDFTVMIRPDSGGSTMVQECSVLKALAHVECFKKFDEQ